MNELQTVLQASELLWETWLGLPETQRKAVEQSYMENVLSKSLNGLTDALTTLDEILEEPILNKFINRAVAEDCHG